MRTGPRNLITDVAGLKVGNAQDDTLKSGVTVLTADAPLMASVHVMGGAPGTRETDLLDPDKSVEGVDALVLSGGSAFGLDAASGVVSGLREQGRGFAVGDVRVPIVPAAIIFDLLNGGRKDWDENPYAALGRAALDDAAEDFDLGSIGAGTGATSATFKGGLGSASVVLPDGVTVGALVAVNPIGTVVTPAGKFWAAQSEFDAEFGGLGGDPASYGAVRLPLKTDAGEGANTTIAIVATDAKLTKPQAKRMAVAAHDGMARAIVPSHTPMDGDLVFAVSAGQKTGDPLMIGHAAATCLARAIARAVFEATPAKGDPLPCFKAKT
ncbi:P1 family peptidase [Litoreibacter janthinus]|uniref:D-aminopeptidase n=1 Tax=Litoreibacter janthinus TaxID=670154 RepID=A0A1I6G563_9RHOB|nr:P1 family peptidase [Litoreibacter janthinus]SFR37348.1 D-aminopeptidase [Litoreibacter janthinus]